MSNLQYDLSVKDKLIKRVFDVILSLAVLILTWWIILIAFIIASIDTGKYGFFLHERIGQHGKKFRIIKIRTMRNSSDYKTTVTTSNDPRITRIGRFFRKTKIDELPQFINVLLGDMSIVGPRPDVPGFADRLENNDTAILLIKPGITGPASLLFKNEEEILAKVDNPEIYNRDVIYP